MGRLDKLFGGERGAAERALKGMQRTYGPKQGKLVFDATVVKRQRRQGRRSPRKGR